MFWQDFVGAGKAHPSFLDLAYTRVRSIRCGSMSNVFRELFCQLSCFPMV